MSSIVIEYGCEPPTPRLRVRRVHIYAEAFAQKAIDTKQWHATARHGGTVANSYGYPAETEAAVVVAAPDGRVGVWHWRCPANKATRSGAARAALPAEYAYAAWLWDARCGEARKQAAWVALKAAHTALFGGPVDEMVVLFARRPDLRRWSGAAVEAALRSRGERRDALLALIAADTVDAAARLAQTFAAEPAS